MSAALAHQPWVLLTLSMAGVTVPPGATDGEVLRALTAVVSAKGRATRITAASAALAAAAAARAAAPAPPVAAAAAVVPWLAPMAAPAAVSAYFQAQRAASAAVGAPLQAAAPVAELPAPLSNPPWFVLQISLRGEEADWLRSGESAADFLARTLGA